MSNCDQGHRLGNRGKPRVIETAKFHRSFRRQTVVAEPIRSIRFRAKETVMLDTIALAFARIFAIVLFLAVIASTSLAAIA